MPSHPSAAPLRLTLTASLLLSALGLTACNSDNNTRFDPPAAPTGLGYEATADANSAVTAYIDAGASNQRGKACFATVDTNAGVRVVSEFLKIWQPRSLFVDAGTTAAADGSCPAVVASDWDGIPGSATDGTVLNSTVHQANINYVIQATSQRTADQAVAAYLDDRRGKNYCISDGMGPLTDAWHTGSQQTTTITSVPADATTVLYSDGGNNRGVGSSSNNDLGLAVDFINDMSSDGSTEPAKRFFKYARPWRWSSSVQVLPTLVPAKSSTPATDGGFISGHSAEALRDALAMAYLVPQRYQEMLTRALELGENRIIAGMHSPLDVIGGRIQGTAVVAYNLNRTDYADIKTTALAEAQSWLLQATGSSDASALYAYAHSATTSNDRFADHATNRSNYLRRLTFGFSPIAATTTAAVVPKGAEVLLETRQPYLTAAQRRVVLRTTALTSGYPVMDDAEGWGRLNLFAAADGYGAFDGDVAVTMNAANGGFSAADSWQNDISGAGKLTKQGSGSLTLTGHNSWTGGTVLEDGTLIAASSSALGKGDVYQQGGVLQLDSSLTVGGRYTLLSGATLNPVLGDEASGRLTVTGDSWLAGELQVTLGSGYAPAVGDTLQILSSAKRHGTFSKVTLNGYSVTPIYSNSGVQLRIDAKSAS